MTTKDEATQHLSVAELSLIEQRVANEGPSMALAYMLWALLWFVSAHRFYLGKPISAVLQIASYFILIGFIWVIVDAFLMPGMVRDKRRSIRQDFARILAARQ